MFEQPPAKLLSKMQMLLSISDRYFYMIISFTELSPGKLHTYFFQTILHYTFLHKTQLFHNWFMCQEQTGFIPKETAGQQE